MLVVSADPALVRVLSLRPAASVRKKRLQGLERNKGKLAPKWTLILQWIQGVNDFLRDLMFSNTDHQQWSQVHPLLEQQREDEWVRQGMATKDIVSPTKYHLAGGQALKTWHNWGHFPICPNGKLSFGRWFIILRFLINYSSPLAQGTLIR